MLASIHSWEELEKSNVAILRPSRTGKQAIVAAIKASVMIIMINADDDITSKILRAYDAVLIFSVRASCLNLH